MKDLEDKVAVVTGAGSGLGAAMARAFAAQGMDVVVVDLVAERAEQTAEDVRGTGRRATAHAVDVSSDDGVAELAEQVFGTFGACHLLHNNAGVATVGRSWEHSAAEWSWMVGVNLFGMTNTLRHFVPRMIAAGAGGQIINTISQNAFTLVPANGMYTTTKHAALGLTETLRYELAPHGIGVTALCPGAMSTRLMESEGRRPGGRRDGDVLAPLIADLKAGTTDALRTPVDVDTIAALAVDGVRRDEPYVMGVTTPREQVALRFDAILGAYDRAGRDHPELP